MIVHAEAVTNPINANSFTEVILLIAEVIITIAVPLAAIFLVYSGILFVTAQGNEEQLKRAKSVFWYTIIGTAVIVGSYAIASAIVEFYSKFGA